MSSASLLVLEALHIAVDAYAAYINANEPDEITWVHEPLTDTGVLTFKALSVTLYTISFTKISNDWVATLNT